jgi:hypothetical protein
MQADFASIYKAAAYSIFFSIEAQIFCYSKQFFIEESSIGR